MIRKDARTNAIGKVRTQIRVVESYRPGNGLAPKQRTIKDFGYIEDQEDPKAFMDMVKAFNASYRERKEPLRIEATETAMMYSEENRRQNYGYKYLEAVYDMLGMF